RLSKSLRRNVNRKWVGEFVSKYPASPSKPPAAVIPTIPAKQFLKLIIVVSGQPSAVLRSSLRRKKAAPITTAGHRKLARDAETVASRKYITMAVTTR